MIEGAGKPNGSSGRSMGLLLVLFSFFYLIHHGNYFYRQIFASDILAKIYIDSGELNAEDFTRAIFQGTNFPSFYGLVPSWLYRHFHVDPFYLTEGMGILQILIAGFGMYAVARAATGRMAVSLLCVAYYLFSDIGMVSPTNWANLSRDLQFTAYGVAFTLAALGALSHARYGLAFFLLGLTACFHAAHAALALLVFSVVVFLEERKKSGFWKLFIRCAACFGAGAAPFIIFILPKMTILGGQALPAAEMAAVVEFLKMLFPFHLFPSTWHPSLYLFYALFLILAWEGSRNAPEKFRMIYRRLVWSYLAVMVGAYIFVEIFPIYAVMKFCPFRVTSHLVLISIPLFFLGLYNLLTANGGFKKILASWILACSFFAQGGLPVVPSVLLIVELTALSRISSIPWQIRIRRGLWAGFMGLTIAFYAVPYLAGGYGPARMISFLYFGSVLVPDLWKVTAAAAAVLAFLPWGRGVSPAVSWNRRTAAILIVLCLAQSVDFWRHRLSADPWVQSYYDAAVWARTNTEPEAMFIVDPSLYGFRDIALREYYLTWKNGFIVWQNPSLYPHFIERLTSLSLSIDELQKIKYGRRLNYISEHFSRLEAPVFVAIRDKHPRCQYILYRNESSPRPAFPIIYQNTSFTVCKISS